MSTIPAPASVDEALAMLQTGMSYLAATAMSAQTQSDCLAALEQLDSVETATRCCTATAPPPAPGNTPGTLGARPAGLGPPGRARRFPPRQEPS